MATATKNVMLLGIDLGTNSTVFQASVEGQEVKHERTIFPSLVGYSKPGIVPGILPSDSDVLFGEQALEYRLHLDLCWPLADGFVDDVETCHAFANFLREQIQAEAGQELWAVVGAPANATPEKQKLIRQAFSGVLDRMLVVPEPFLSAMGLRDDSRVGKDPDYVDPTKHSLIVDIGAGTTDCCLVQGYFPSAEDQLSVPLAGDSIDEALAKAIQKRYPDVKLTRVTVTRLKEECSFVGEMQSAEIKVFVDGKPRKIDLGEIMRDACDILTEPVLDCIRQLLARCDSEAVLEVMHNIIVTGGGSQIRGFSEQIEQKLHDEGYEDARVVTPEDYRHLVAKGALKIANNVRDDQWQVPL
ncbi:MAG: rod shape-determining protein [Planctomycetes bacterium]|nr:rod shape-determining protein [Planctomycetota bacterium]